MPYSGGSSTNAGILYQNWFLALQLSYAFFENNFDVFPEALRNKSVIVDDIAIKHRAKDVFYSLKFRSPATNLHWSPSTLNSQSIFRDFKKQHEANPQSKIFLVSECNCYLFSEVFMRARNALVPHDIPDVLVTDFAITQWESAKKYLGYNDFELIRFSKNVNIRVLPIQEIKTLVKHRFNTHTNHSGIETFLFEKAVDCSSNKTYVNKLVLNNWFEEEGIEFNKSRI